MLVTECWRLESVQPTVLFWGFLPFSVPEVGCLSIMIVRIIVTDNGVTQSVVPKESSWNFDGYCDESLVPSCLPQQYATWSQSTAELTPALFEHTLIAFLSQYYLVGVFYSMSVMSLGFLALSEDTQINNFTTKWHFEELFSSSVTFAHWRVRRVVRQWLPFGIISSELLLAVTGWTVISVWGLLLASRINLSVWTLVQVEIHLLHVTVFYQPRSAVGLLLIKQVDEHIVFCFCF